MKLSNEALEAAAEVYRVTEYDSEVTAMRDLIEAALKHDGLVMVPMEPELARLSAGNNALTYADSTMLDAYRAMVRIRDFDDRNKACKEDQTNEAG